MLKNFILLILFIPVVAFSQTAEVSDDVKKHCKGYGDYTYWAEEESICSVTIKGEKTVMHYVGGWSLEGADGYGQFYEYNADDGTLMSIYKGQFKKSMFNGFGRYEVIFENLKGESMTSITIGNWKNDLASGFVYQKMIDNLTQKTHIFYGEMVEGKRHGNSIIDTINEVNSVTWLDNKYKENTPIFLYKDEIAHGWVQHKFFYKDTDILKSKKNVESEKISIKNNEE